MRLLESKRQAATSPLTQVRMAFVFMIDGIRSGPPGSAAGAYC